MDGMVALADNAETSFLSPATRARAQSWCAHRTNRYCTITKRLSNLKHRAATARIHWGSCSRDPIGFRGAWRVLDQPRSSQRFEGKPRDEDTRLTKRILELVRQRPRWGYRRIGVLLRNEGEELNMKRMYRLWHAAVWSSCYPPPYAK